MNRTAARAGADPGYDLVDGRRREVVEELVREVERHRVERAQMRIDMEVSKLEDGGWD